MSDQLQDTLIREGRWTPKAFSHFGVLLEGSLVKFPLWSDRVLRTYDMAQMTKESRRKNPSGTKATLFGDIKSHDVILLEGEWDLMAAFEAGFSNVVTGTNGASTFTSEMAKLLKGKKVSIVYDNDKAGRDGAQRASKILQSESCLVRIVSLPDEVGDGGDVRDFLIKFGNKGALQALIDATPWSEPIVCETREPIVHSLAAVQRQEVEWLWKPRIPKGAPTVVVGEPGVGKSFLMAYLAANVSTGGFLKDDFSSFSRGPVLIFNMEDSLECTIKMRIDETEADQNVIFAVNEKILFDEEGADKIRSIVDHHKPSLVIFDPIASFLGADTNMNAANQVRDKMEFTIKLAREHNLAVVCVMHTNKNEQQVNLLNRTTGSVDFIGSVRSVLMVVKHPTENDVRLLGHIKCNLSSPASTLSYKISAGKRIEIIGSDERSLDKILFDLGAGSKSQAAKGEAIEFVLEVLKDGPMRVKDLLADAAENGIAKSTLNRARKDITVKRKISHSGPGASGGYWIVYLTEDESRYRNLGHLDLLARWGDDESDQQHQEIQDEVTGDGNESSMKGES